jgi:hypothetical protein
MDLVNFETSHEPTIASEINNPNEPIECRTFSKRGRELENSPRKQVLSTNN